VLPGFLLHRGRYAEALETVRTMQQTPYTQSKTVAHALAGQALIGLGRLDEAQQELSTAQRLLATVPQVTPGIVPNRTLLAGWVESLRGELLLRTGQREPGRAVFKETQRALRAVPGPDAWTQALFRLESMARSAREAGDWELAEYTARQMLEHDAAYGGSHLALALVLQHAGDTAGASTEFAAARKLWGEADPDLPELAQIEAARVAAR
jgi:Flp pilus assembly protein TadD